MIGMFLWLKMTWYLSWWRHLTHVSHIIDQQVIHSSLNTGSHFWAQQIKQSQYFLLYLSDVCHRCDLVKCSWTLVTLLTLSARPCSRPEDPLLSFSSSFRSLMVQGLLLGNSPAGMMVSSQKQSVMLLISITEHVPVCSLSPAGPRWLPDSTQSTTGSVWSAGTNWGCGQTGVLISSLWLSLRPRCCVNMCLC